MSRIPFRHISTSHFQQFVLCDFGNNRSLIFSKVQEVIEHRLVDHSQQSLGQLSSSLRLLSHQNMSSIHK